MPDEYTQTLCASFGSFGFRLVITMKSNQAIMKKWKSHVYGFFVLLLIQVMGFPLVNVLLKEFIVQTNVYKIVLLTIVSVCILVDCCVLVNRIFRLRILMKKCPVKCKIVDILLIGYKEDARTRYDPFFIVQSDEDQKMYLTYGKYSLSGCTARIDYSDRENIRCTVYKNNGNPVQLGDEVDMYFLKTVSVPVCIDQSKNTVKLKGEKVYFRHMNEKIDINIFKKIVFFKGAIDLC